MKNSQKGFIVQVVLVVIVLLLIGGGVYFYKNQKITSLSTNNNHPKSVKYFNSVYKYSFYHTEPPFSVFKCDDSDGETKLVESDGTESFVVLYSPYLKSSSELPKCNQSVEWYKIDGYQASILAVKESDQQWMQRVIEFQKIPTNVINVIESPSQKPSEILYRKDLVTGSRTKIINGKNVQVADTDIQIISRHNGFSYSVRTDALGRTAVLGLLDSMKYGDE